MTKLASFPAPKVSSGKQGSVVGAAKNSEGTSDKPTKTEKGSFITSRASGVKNIKTGTG
jgi:hypothetical protein